MNDEFKLRYLDGAISQSKWELERLEKIIQPSQMEKYALLIKEAEIAYKYIESTGGPE